MKKLGERVVGFKLSALLIIAFGVGIYCEIEFFPVRAMKAIERVMDVAVAIGTVLAEIGFVLWIMYVAIYFLRDGRNRAQFLRFVNNWPLLAGGILCMAACLGWYFSMGVPRSWGWGDYGPAPATAPFTGTPERLVEKWVLVEDGEIWLHYSADTRDQYPPATEPVAAAHGFVSPMTCGFTGGSLTQGLADKYEGAWASHWFAGLAFRSERWDGSNRHGWSYSRGWECFLSIPFWIFAVPLVVALPLRFRNWHRQEVGRCSLCTYDLRAHKPGDKCPECGTLIPPRGPATITPEERSRSCPPSVPPG